MSIEYMTMKGLWRQIYIKHNKKTYKTDFLKNVETKKTKEKPNRKTKKSIEKKNKVFHKLKFQVTCISMTFTVPFPSFQKPFS